MQNKFFTRFNLQVRYKNLIFLACKNMKNLTEIPNGTSDGDDVQCRQLFVPPYTCIPSPKTRNTNGLLTRWLAIGPLCEFYIGTCSFRSLSLQIWFQCATKYTGSNVRIVDVTKTKRSHLRLPNGENSNLKIVNYVTPTEHSCCDNYNLSNFFHLIYLLTLDLILSTSTCCNWLGLIKVFRNNLLKYKFSVAA